MKTEENTTHNEFMNPQSIKKTKTITIEEALDVYCYALNKEQQEEIRKHYKKYGDWGRLKSLIIGAIVAQNRENRELKEKIEKLRKGIDSTRQIDLFYHLPERHHADFE